LHGGRLVEADKSQQVYGPVETTTTTGIYDLSPAGTLSFRLRNALVRFTAIVLDHPACDEPFPRSEAAERSDVPRKMSDVPRKMREAQAERKMIGTCRRLGWEGFLQMTDGTYRQERAFGGEHVITDLTFEQPLDADTHACRVDVTIDTGARVRRISATCVVVAIGAYRQLVTHFDPKELEGGGLASRAFARVMYFDPTDPRVLWYADSWGYAQSRQ
jgi:hypothetical protein